jgi:hypothetical protein
MVSYLACLEGGDTIEVTVIGYAFVEVWLGVVHLRVRGSFVWMTLD